VYTFLYTFWEYIIDYNFNPGKDEFISLMPNQIFEASITIYFGKGPVYISTKRGYYNGLFFYLDKTDSYFFWRMQGK
jgi:hypothetical protein